MIPLALFLLLLCSSAVCDQDGSATGLLATNQKSAGVAANPVKLNGVDSIINQAIADGNIPGAVLVVGHDGKVIYR